MKPQHFLKQVEHARIHHAIKWAEKGTSADIVLLITNKAVEDPVAAAGEAFKRMRLETAPDQNSLLFYLAPKSQKFAVVGGADLHAKVGQEWWEALSAILTKHFREGQYTEGLIEGITVAGKALKKHFPAENPDRTGQQDIVEE